MKCPCTKTKHPGLYLGFNMRVDNAEVCSLCNGTLLALPPKVESVSLSSLRHPGYDAYTWPTNKFRTAAMKGAYIVEMMTSQVAGVLYNPNTRVLHSIEQISRECAETNTIALVSLQ